MSNHRFKIIYLPEGRSQVREFNFNRGKVFLLFTIVAFIILAIVAGLSTAFITLFPDYRLQAMSRENELLYEQVAQAQEKMMKLQSQIDDLAESDTRLRLMADLPLIDDATREAGIGGSLPSPGIDPVQDMQNLLTKLEHQINLQKQSFPEILKKIEENLDVAAHTPAISPVEEIRITSKFGYRKDPFTGLRRPHKGLDFGAPRGTPVFATADGRVVMVKRVPTFGKVVMIDHGYGYETVFGHLHSFNVKVGDKVKRGDIIGTVGNTGRSNGSHLHYEVRINNKQVDPMDFVFDESMITIK